MKILVVDDEKLRLPPSGMPYPFREVRSGKERQFHYGYSDHFPILIRLKWRPRP